MSTIFDSKGLVIGVGGRSGSSSVWYSEGRSVLVSVVSSSSGCEFRQEYVLSWFYLSIRVSHRVRLSFVQRFGVFAAAGAERESSS